MRIIKYHHKFVVLKVQSMTEKRPHMVCFLIDYRSHSLARREKSTREIKGFEIKAPAIPPLSNTTSTKPREEINKINNLLHKIIYKVDKKLHFVICGSYRRLKSKSNERSIYFTMTSRFAFLLKSLNS